MPDKQLIPPVIIPDNHDMGIVKILGIGINIIKFHIFPGVVINIVEDHHKLTEVFVDFLWGFKRCGEQDLNWGLLIEVFLELVELSLVVFVEIFLTALLFVFDGDGFLALGGGEFLALFSLLGFYLVEDVSTLHVDLNSFLFVFDVAGCCFDRVIELLSGFWSGPDTFLTLGLSLPVLLNDFLLALLSHRNVVLL